MFRTFVRLGAACVPFLLGLSFAEVAGAHETDEPSKDEPAKGCSCKNKGEEPVYPIGLWGRPVNRGGFHFQATFGVGGGPDTLGLFHAMEIGYSWDKHTVALLHTFIQNKDILGTDPTQPDLIGGWMLEYKRTLFFPDLEWKAAAGLGGTHDQSGESLKAIGGFGMAYGLDLHFPLFKGNGPTLSLQGMNIFSAGDHHFGAGLGLGYTWF